MAGLAGREDAAAQQARAGLGRGFRTLVSQGGIDRAEELVAIVTERGPVYWPEARNSLADVLAYDRNGLDAGVEERVRALMDRLTPTDLATRVRFLVSEMPWDYPGDEKLDYKAREARQIEVIEQLGAELLGRPAELVRLLAPLSRGQHQMTFALGQALAKIAERPLVWEQPILEAYANAPVGERNFGLLAGYYVGLAERHPTVVEGFKVKASASEVNAAALPLVCWRLGITQEDIRLVCEALKSGKLRPDLLRQWTLGGVLAKVPVLAVAPLFDMLLVGEGEAYGLALDLIGMYVHGQQARLEELRPQLILATENIDRLVKEPRSRTDDFHLKELIDWLLKKGRTDEDACKIALILAKKIAAADESVASAELGKSLLPRLLSSFPEIVWPILGEAIVSDRKNAWRLELALGDSFSFEVKRPAILQLPPTVLLAWCHAHPDVAPAFVVGLLPVLTSREADRMLHPTMKRLLDEFGDRADVLSALGRNMYTFGWRGSRTEYFELYDEPLRELENHRLGQVRRWAKKTRQQLRRDIDETRIEEEERQARWEQ